MRRYSIAVFAAIAAAVGCGPAQAPLPTPTSVAASPSPGASEQGHHRHPTPTPRPTATPTPKPTPSPTPKPTPSPHVAFPRLMIGVAVGSENAVQAVMSDHVASAALNGSRPLLNVANAGNPGTFPAAPPSVPAAWKAQYIYRWASEAQMKADFGAHLVPSWITVCMYDNEPQNAAPVTPPNEVADPAPYYTKAAALCHAHGMTIIPSAGMRGGFDQAVIDTAGSWDGYSMQVQTEENDLPKFVAAIAHFESTIHAVNPAITTWLVGVGDFAGGTLQLAPAIEAAMHAAPAGSAFWLNFGPHSGPGCTDTAVCPIPGRPDLLVQVIKDIAR